MSVELSLSIFATIVSLCGLILHFIRFRREKPNLHIEVTRFKHHFASAKVKKTELKIEFYVHNKGDRATQLNKLELQTYNQTQVLKDAVDAHKSIRQNCYFVVPSRIEKQKLQCSFVLYHTHGEKRFEATSEETPQSLLTD